MSEWVPAIFALYPWRPEDDARSFWSSRHCHCHCQLPKLGAGTQILNPLKEQKVLWTFEPSLSPLSSPFFFKGHQPLNVGVTLKSNFSLTTSTKILFPRQATFAGQELGLNPRFEDTVYPIHDSYKSGSKEWSKRLEIKKFLIVTTFLRRSFWRRRGLFHSLKGIAQGGGRACDRNVRWLVPEHL